MNEKGLPSTSCISAVMFIVLVPFMDNERTSGTFKCTSNKFYGLEVLPKLLNLQYMNFKYVF